MTLLQLCRCLGAAHGEQAQIFLQKFLSAQLFKDDGGIDCIRECGMILSVWGQSQSGQRTAESGLLAAVEIGAVEQRLKVVQDKAVSAGDVEVQQVGQQNCPVAVSPKGDFLLAAAPQTKFLPDAGKGLLAAQLLFGDAGQLGDLRHDGVVDGGSNQPVKGF